MLRKLPLKTRRSSTKLNARSALASPSARLKKAPPTLKERVTDGAENQQGRNYAGSEELSEGYIPPALADPIYLLYNTIYK